MNHMSRLVTVVACMSLMSSHAHSGPEQLHDSTKVFSPNNKFVAVYHPDQIEIIDADTGQLYDSFSVLPVYALKWTGDSKTLAVVQHIAHGSEAVLVHFNGTKWEKLLIPPPGEGYTDYAVVSVEPEYNLVRLSYKARGAAIYLV